MGALLQETRPVERNDDPSSNDMPVVLTQSQPLQVPENQQQTHSRTQAVMMPTPILYFSYFFFAAALMALTIGIWMELTSK